MPAHRAWYNEYMKDDQFDKLFKYIEERFDSVAHELSEIRGDIRMLMNTPDDIAKRLDVTESEQVARDA